VTAAEQRRAAFIAIATTIAIAAAFVFALSAPGQRYLAPGELQGSHAAKVSKCSACHDPFFGSPDVNCERCHKAVAKARLARHGSHAGMVGACVDCHFMHRRLGQPALVLDPAGVDHNRMRFALSRHEKQLCRDCHSRDFKRFSRAQSRRCVNCHLRIADNQRAQKKSINVAWAGESRPDKFDRHRRAVGFNCLKCHRGGARLKYDHKTPDTFFAGRHAAAKCAACHRRDNYRQAGAACLGCHKRRSHGPEYAGCDRCHSLNGWKPASPDHTGKLQGAHQDLKCVRCHPDNRWAGLNWTCVKCHQNPHQGGAADDCLKCHNETHWKPAKMDHGAATDACIGCHKPPGAHFPGSCGSCHSVRAWKPAKAAHIVRLIGAHTALACAACHKGGRYAGLSWACASCHRSSHNNYGSNCAVCHTQSSWKGALFKHGGTSGDCSACHTAPNGHYPGSCSQCHKTPGSWAGTIGNHPRVGEHTSSSFPCAYCHPSGYGSSDCTRCHKQGAPRGD